MHADRRAAQARPPAWGGIEEPYATELGIAEVTAIPVSALAGDDPAPPRGAGSKSSFVDLEGLIGYGKFESYPRSRVPAMATLS
ncbi:hypothetical protein ABZO31_00630 [Streptomyces sp. HUAS MG47]|uniref:hypothetical protein n=1 Tax=Streptomyces solicamelliae TaxID=3231716 RepID=UPI0038780821